MKGRDRSVEEAVSDAGLVEDEARGAGVVAELGAEPEIVQGDLNIDLARHTVSLAGEAVRLTRKEFDLLALLARNAGRILTHRQILNDIWGPAHEHDLQYLRVFVGRLRAKLGDDPSAPRFILNEPGVGYRFLD